MEYLVMEWNTLEYLNWNTLAKNIVLVMTLRLLTPKVTIVQFQAKIFTER